MTANTSFIVTGGSRRFDFGACGGLHPAGTSLARQRAPMRTSRTLFNGLSISYNENEGSAINLRPLWSAIEL
jgi:hypothetical protein